MKLSLLNFNKIFSDPFSSVIFLLTLFLSFAGAIFLLLFLKQIPPQVPLFYSAPWGEKQLTDKLFLFILPVSGFLILFINAFFADHLKEIEILGLRLLFVFAFFYNLLTTLTLLKIVFLVVF